MNDNNDTISRQAIIEKLKEHYNFFVDVYGGFENMPLNIKLRVDEITNCIAEVVNIPAVQPEQKIGRWIYTNTIGGMRYYGCSICANQEKDCIADEHEIQWYNYCPNCGAKMESEVTE